MINFVFFFNGLEKKNNTFDNFFLILYLLRVLGYLANKYV